jgi:hypothetical protein
VPEIYNVANAAEWQSLNHYVTSVGLPRMVFAGVLSEGGAAGTLSGSDSWNFLKSATGQAAPFLSVIGAIRHVSPQEPDSPTAVTAVPGPGLVTLAWSAPAWDGGSGVAAYRVTVFAGSKLAEVVTVGGSPTPETAIIAGLVNGTSYTFYISATNQVGSGFQSLPAGTVAPSALFPLR